MKPMKIFAVVAEATVITTLAVSSYHIAFGGAVGWGDWLAGAPILTVVALESLRLPIAFDLPKARLLGLCSQRGDARWPERDHRRGRRRSRSRT